MNRTTRELLVTITIRITLPIEWELSVDADKKAFGFRNKEGLSFMPQIGIWDFQDHRMYTMMEMMKKYDDFSSHPSKAHSQIVDLADPKLGPYRQKYMTLTDAELYSLLLDTCPRALYWKDLMNTEGVSKLTALPVKIGQFVYDVKDHPEIYQAARW